MYVPRNLICVSQLLSMWQNGCVGLTLNGEEPPPVSPVVVIASSGSFDVIADDGTAKERFHLNRSYYGLYLPPLVWREIENFSSNSVCLVLASEPYSAADYYYEYEGFAEAVGAKR